MPHQPTDSTQCDGGRALAGTLLDALVELTLRRDLDGLRRPLVLSGAGSRLQLRGEGISRCPSCGGPRRVHRIGPPGRAAAPLSHFCARCWQLDLVDRDGTVRGRASRRLERLVRELPAAARPTSLVRACTGPDRERSSNREPRTGHAARAAKAG